MPYEIKKLPNECFAVVNKNTGEVHSKCTTKEKAEAQIKLLRAIEHNPLFRKIK